MSNQYISSKPQSTSKAMVLELPRHSYHRSSSSCVCLFADANSVLFAHGFDPGLCVPNNTHGRIYCFGVYIPSCEILFNHPTIL